MCYLEKSVALDALQAELEVEGDEMEAGMEQQLDEHIEDEVAGGGGGIVGGDTGKLLAQGERLEGEAEHEAARDRDEHLERIHEVDEERGLAEPHEVVDEREARRLDAERRKAQHEHERHAQVGGQVGDAAVEGAQCVYFLAARVQLVVEATDLALLGHDVGHGELEVALGHLGVHRLLHAVRRDLLLQVLVARLVDLDEQHAREHDHEDERDQRQVAHDEYARRRG